METMPDLTTLAGLAIWTILVVRIAKAISPWFHGPRTVAAGISVAVLSSLAVTILQTGPAGANAVLDSLIRGILAGAAAMGLRETYVATARPDTI